MKWKPRKGDDVAAGTLTVNAEIRIEAPPDAVFPFLTDPEKIVRWKGVDATVEASPAGCTA